MARPEAGLGVRRALKKRLPRGVERIEITLGLRKAMPVAKSKIKVIKCEERQSRQQTPGSCDDVAQTSSRPEPNEVKGSEVVMAVKSWIEDHQRNKERAKESVRRL
jgi:hypothetical protein